MFFLWRSHCKKQQNVKKERHTHFDALAFNTTWLSWWTFPSKKEIAAPQIYMIIRLSVNHAVCLMTGQQPVPKRVLHRLRSNASSSHLQHPLFSLWSSIEAYLFFLIFPSLLSFPLSFLQQSISKGSCYVRCEKCSWLSFFLLYVGNFSPLWFYVNTSSFLTRSLQLFFSSTMFQNFPGTSDQLSAVSTFQHHTWRTRHNVK